MSLSTFLIFLKISSVIFAGVICYYVFRALLFTHDKSSSILHFTQDKVQKSLEKISHKKHVFNPDYIKYHILSKKGLMFHIRDYDLEASTYFILKGTLGVFVEIIFVIFIPHDLFLQIHPVFYIVSYVIGFPFGFILPDIYMNIINDKDNQDMIDDIYQIYCMFMIHNEAEVHILDSFYMCYKKVKNERLKEALLEFCNNISSHRMTITDALKLFELRFDNEEIERLCILVVQSQDTGRSADMIESLLNQMNSLQESDNYVKEKKLEIQMLVFLALFFAGIIFLFGYGLVILMFDSISNF